MKSDESTVGMLHTAESQRQLDKFIDYLAELSEALEQDHIARAEVLRQMARAGSMFSDAMQVLEFSEEEIRSVVREKRVWKKK